MLVPVALHQARFQLPGLSTDARGVALGARAAVLLPSLDGLVTWLRILSERLPLDDLLPTLVIHEVRGAAGSLEFLVVYAATSSSVVDRAARAAELAGGQCYTGAGRHLVRYRDARAPLGYDVEALSTDAQADFLLYGEHHVQPLARRRELPFAQLLFRLSPRPEPPVAADEDAELDRGPLWLAVAPGLLRTVLSYLVRSGVRAQAALVEREERSVFGVDPAAAPGGVPSPTAGARYLVVRPRRLPERMRALFSSMPGVALYRPVLDQVLVEAGYRHPLQLASCRTVFDPERLYLFHGRAGHLGGAAVDVLGFRAQGADLVDVLALVDTGYALSAGEGGRGPSALPANARAAQPAAVPVTLRLSPTSTGPRQVNASFLPWSEAERLKQLVFLLPPTLLGAAQVAAFDEGLLVVSAGSADPLPIGELHYEAAPSIYVPLGFELLPRLRPEVLVEHVGGTGGRRVLFLRGAAGPIAIEESAFEPLSRRVLGRAVLPSRSRSARLPHAPSVSTAEVTLNPPGPFPLWGYDGGALEE